MSAERRKEMMTFKQVARHPDRIIGHSELFDMVGLSKSHIARMERNGAFPERIKLGKRKVGWSLKEIQEWVEVRKKTRKLVDQEIGV